MASLIFSLLLTFGLTKKRRRFFVGIAVILFGLACVLFYVFQSRMNKSVVEIEKFTSDSTTARRKYFVGTILLNDPGGPADYVKIHPNFNRKDLLEAFSNDVTKVWELSSIWDLQLNIAILYFCFVISAVSCISLSTELLARRR
jgi:hypothetical protein